MVVLWVVFGSLMVWWKGLVFVPQPCSARFRNVVAKTILSVVWILLEGWDRGMTLFACLSYDHHPTCKSASW